MVEKTIDLSEDLDLSSPPSETENSYNIRVRLSSTETTNDEDMEICRADLFYLDTTNDHDGK